MTAAVFIGGDGPPAIRGLPALGTVDLIVAADSGLDSAESWGLVPDWIVGDMDSIKDESRLKAYPSGRIRRFPRDKDFTDTELALLLLTELNCDDAFLVGGGGGRLDHILALVALFERTIPPKRWLTASEDIRMVDAESGSGHLTLDINPATLVSLFPIGIGPWKVSSSGLKWPLQDAQWERGLFGISNTAETDVIRITALKGRFLVILPL